MANALQEYVQKSGAVLLPDNDQWTHRVQIRSETSTRLYVIAKHKTNGTLGCSCMGWIRHRHCKHLRVFAPVLQAAGA